MIRNSLLVILCLALIYNCKAFCVTQIYMCNVKLSNECKFSNKFRKPALSFVLCNQAVAVDHRQKTSAKSNNSD